MTAPKIEWLCHTRRGKQVAHAFVDQADWSVCGSLYDHDTLGLATEHDRHCKACTRRLALGEKAFEPRRGKVWFNSWAGRTSANVEIVGETPKRYRVRFLEPKSGSGMWACRSAASPGDVRLVPKQSVTFDPPEHTAWYMQGRGAS